MLKMEMSAKLDKNSNLKKTTKRKKAYGTFQNMLFFELSTCSRILDPHAHVSCRLYSRVNHRDRAGLLSTTKANGLWFEHRGSIGIGGAAKHCLASL